MLDNKKERVKTIKMRLFKILCLYKIVDSTKYNEIDKKLKTKETGPLMRTDALKKRTHSRRFFLVLVLRNS